MKPFSANPVTHIFWTCVDYWLQMKENWKLRKRTPDEETLTETEKLYFKDDIDE